jgi:hypothetical protein
VKTRVIAVLIAATLGAGTATAYAATLGIGSWHLWTGSQTLTKGTCTITSTSSANAISDTYVSEAATTTNFGSATTMNVRADVGNRAWTFVRFDLSSCALPTTAGADTATLKLVVKTPANNSRTLTATAVLATWAESLLAAPAFALPYASAPTTTFATGTTAGATLSIPVTIDIDALIKNSSANYGWRIDDEGTTTKANLTVFNSSEATNASNRPQLVINYEK